MPITPITPTPTALAAHIRQAQADGDYAYDRAPLGEQASAYHLAYQSAVRLWKFEQPCPCPACARQFGEGEKR